MYEINFYTKFSPSWFADVSQTSSGFYVFWYEIKFHTKGFGRKSTEFSYAQISSFTVQMKEVKGL